MTKKVLAFLLLGMLLITNKTNAQQWGDYTLYSVQNSTTTQLMDTSRTVVKTWTHTGYKTGYSSYLTAGGYLYKTISRTGNSFTGGPICGQLIKMDYTGNIVWDYIYSTTDYCSHHDFHVMPNGNVLLIAYERKTAAEVAAAGGTFNGEVWSEHIAEIKQTGPTTGEVVWKWSFWDHLVQNTDATKPNYQTSIVNHPELLNINYLTKKDWLHANGIDYNPMLDQIVISSHNLNEWYVIDHSTTTAEAATHTGGNAGKGGDFLYRWGNPAAYGAAGTAILKVTHDAHWIPEGTPNAGRLVGFNNQGVSTTKSAVDQIMPPLNGYNYNITNGLAFEPATYLERHAANGYTSNMGNSMQLPNGNMLVCLSILRTVYEVAPDGSTIWTKTFTGSIPQAFKYEKCFIENEPPTIPIITNNKGVLTATNANTYQWYKNGQKITNETNQSLTTNDSGMYLVRITDSIGCVYRYSQGIKVGKSSSTGVAKQFAVKSFQVYPNPTTGIININSNGINNYLVSVYSVDGKLVAQNFNSESIDLSNLKNSIYTIIISNSLNQKTIHKIILAK